MSFLLPQHLLGGGRALGLLQGHLPSVGFVGHISAQAPLGVVGDWVGQAWQARSLQGSVLGWSLSW